MSYREASHCERCEEHKLRIYELEAQIAQKKSAAFTRALEALGPYAILLCALLVTYVVVAYFNNSNKNNFPANCSRIPQQAYLDGYRRGCLEGASNNCR